MALKFRRARALQRVACIVSIGTVAASASAEVAGDVTYVHCRDSGGDFRISELNHSVSYFSDRYQAYRPVCRDCEITEWGANVTMKDGAKTVVQIDRVSGRIWIRGSDAKDIPGSYAVRPFQGICVKGGPAIPRKLNGQTARAF